MDSIRSGAESKPLGIDEIVSLFERIDRQILDLHQCSSDDFLGLNAKFKGFFKEAKGISTSAGSLFLLFSEGANRKLVESLEQFYEKLTQSQSQLSKQLNDSLQTLSEVRNTLSALYIPLRNIAQNVGTMGLLLTNLNLSGRTAHSRDAGGAVAFQQLRAEVEQLVRDALATSRKAQGYNKRLDASRQQIELIQNQTLRGVESVMNSVHYGLILFAEKHEDANIRIPEITEKTDSCSQSIAGIITNLQYQDIIRQKMEHIQSAHQSLMANLTQFQKGEQSDEQYYTQLLVQVRDISALQSAQLVATNREYQSAIETISRHFRDIASDMEHIAGLCHESLRAGGARSGETVISDLVTRLQQSGRVLGDFSTVVPVLRDEFTTLTQGSQELIRDLQARHEQYASIRMKLMRIIGPVGGDNDEESLLDVTTQIDTVLNDLDMFDALSLEHCNNLERDSDALRDYEARVQGAMPLWSGFQDGAQKMHGIAKRLEETEHESTALLAQIEAMSKKVSRDTRQGLDEIRYYDFFGKVIEEIISGLNAISDRIRAEVSADISSNMDSIRSLYTMASEHQIHDSFAGGDTGNVDLFGGEVIDGSGDSDGDDDDGLELF